MTIQATLDHPASGRRLLLEAFRDEPRFASATLLLVLAIIPTLFAMALDGRTLNGVSVWSKPLKFEVALAVYFGTLAWFARWVSPEARASRGYRLFSGIVVSCVTAEMLWIVGAAAFGVASHFNVASPLMAALYGLMGLFAVTLTSAAPLYGVLIHRHRGNGLNPTLRLALTTGLGLTFVLTVLVAGFMASGQSHLIGGNGSDAEGLAFMGWARDGGDLRVAHFFASHAMHVIPAFGLLVAMLGIKHGRAAVAAFSAAFIAFVVYVFAEALLGQPFLAVVG
ncbi:MAG: hypothetical protein FJX65_15555 [Alphaproteobacteria bacterium]|nr:hypothetical protein [Alphaproteobacteria bacterium]